MSAWAKRGVKCVCIRKSAWISSATMEATPFGPKFEEIVTIALVVTHELFGDGLHFVEYPTDLQGNPPVYPIMDFRPVAERDAALFHHLLAPQSDEVPA